MEAVVEITRSTSIVHTNNNATSGSDDDHDSHESQQRRSNSNSEEKISSLTGGGGRGGSVFSCFGLFAAADATDWFLMFMGTIGSSVHGAALPIFFVIFGHLIDSLGSLTWDNHDLLNKISKNALALVYLGLMNLVSAWIGVACWTQTGERQAADMRVKCLQSVLNQDIGFFDMEARDQNILFRISSDAILVQDAIGDKTGHALRYFSQFVAGFLIGFVTAWRLTLMTIAVIPLVAIVGGIYAVTMSTLSKKGEAVYAKAGHVAEEAISQVRTVYSFVGEDKVIDEYSKSLKDALKLTKKSGLVKGAGIGITYGSLFCVWALLLWYSGILVRRHKINGGKAFTTVINSIFSGFALGQAAPNLAAMAKGQAAASNIISMIQMQADLPKKSDSGLVLPEVSGNIEFSEVSFAYPSRSNMVFESLSFSINAGKTCAVVGQSGSGKSTIISLVERFYEPTSGKALLDGHDLKTLQLKWLRQQIGLVSQEPALFATSIAENILYGREDANMEHIVEAAKASNAHSFIQSLPDGYNTQVGEGGIQLSGGQKQRIAIARAVVRNPKILLLDEATSALDAESEHVVQKALVNVMENRTTIIVAHRLSTIRDADTIMVLKNGQVVQRGSHLELMCDGEDGEYAALVRLQGSSYVKNRSHQENSNDHSQAIISSEIHKSKIEDHKSKSAKAKGIRIRKQLAQSSSKSSPLIWKLIKMNKPEWPFALLGSIGAVLSGVQSPLFALGITYVLDAYYSFDNSKSKHEIEVVALSFLGLAVVTIPTYMLQHYFYTSMGERLTTRVRLMMFSAILQNEIGWFDLDENSTGSLISKLAAGATVVRTSLAERLSTIMQNMSLTLTAFIISFIFCWRVAAVVIATLPLITAAAVAEQLFLRGFGGNYSKAYSRTTDLAREAITNIRTVAAFCAEDKIVEKFIFELNIPAKHALLRGHISGICYGASQFLAFSAYGFGLWYTSTLIRKQYTTFGDSMKSFVVLVVTAMALAETLALTPEIMKGSQALAQVFGILERRTAIEPSNPTAEVVTEIKGDIEFRKVTFKYPSRPEVTVLEDLNLSVSAGNSLAIVGQSGSGKSSIISLLMRFYDPTSGVITIDGLDIRSLNLRSLRRKIGLVQQEPALFSTTIYENIKYGREGASEIEIMKAAKAANAHTFISRMPDGYQTQVGERGTQLSGGQKQRVAIARAILKDPAILLLDEATSALDTTSEKVVQEALDKLMQGRTNIIVAHRLSTIREANVICVLQDGRVVETGSHHELSNMPESAYTKLISLQQEAN
ncbi:hypothetical protein Sjap_009930 [Stephania japonica]|uniref:Uncharacterized protein n=1 Tax=Stephania japonica TaxID=461633 RepID=A0AAP0P3S8_9MAGN